MVEFLPLEHLLRVGRSHDTPVAARDRVLVDFGSFKREVCAWHAAFARQAGQNWAMFLDDSVAFAAALFGAWHAQKCVWLAADRQPHSLTTLSSVVDGFAGDLPSELDPLQPSASAELTFAPLDVDAQLLVVYTSGSSGTPLALHKRLRQLFAEVNNLQRCWPDLSQRASVLATVSHQHIYGLLFRVLWPLASGRLILAERLEYPEELHATLLRLECQRQDAILVSSPAHLKRLSSQLPWADCRGALAVVFSSGGPLPSAAVLDCQELLAATPIEVYGSSETGGIAWRQRFNETDSTWVALPGVELQVEGEALSVRSAHLPDDDWYLTADRVQASGHGHDHGFELLGRADRIVKIEERRVSLAELERALLSSGLLSDVRLLSMADTETAQRTQLAVVAVPNSAGWACWERSGKRALNDALRDRLRTHVAGSALPRRWRYVSALPINSQGKTSERQLLNLFDSRRPQPCVLSRSAQQAVLEIEIDPRSPYFEGHFPQTPILPGVVQIDWALRLGQELFALPAQFRKLEAVKFVQVIKPNARVRLELDFALERACLAFRYLSAIGQHASGRILFEAAA